MKRVVLHIGLPKTGSTAIQKFLFHNRSVLEQNGIGYFFADTNYVPWRGRSNADIVIEYAHANLRKTYTFPPSTYQRRKLPEIDATLLQQDMDALREYAQSYDTLIFSEEFLAQYEIYFVEFWSLAKEFLETCIGTDVQIDVMVYLRRQDDWALSRYKEYVRDTPPHCSLPFKKALVEIEAAGYLDYAGLVDRLAACFGQEHVIVRCYDKDSFYGGDIFHDFLHAARLDELEGLEYLAGDLYPSLSMDVAEALRRAKKTRKGKKTHPIDLWNRAFQLTLDTKHVGYEHPLSLKERQQLYDKYAESNDRIAKTYLGRDKLFEEPTGATWKPRQLRILKYELKLLYPGLFK